MTKRVLLVLLFCSSVLSAQPKTPSQVYLEYRAVLEKATSLEALQPFLAARLVAQVAEIPDKPKVLEALKQVNTAYQIHIVADTELPDGHVLIVDGVDGADVPIRATVDLVKEAGVWKIAKESWHRR